MYEISITDAENTTVISATGPLELVNYAARLAKDVLADGEYSARITNGSRTVAAIHGDAEIVALVLNKRLRSEKAAGKPVESAAE